MPYRSDPEFKERKFWGRVDRSGGPLACWPWLGRTNDKGYGYTYVTPTKTIGAHRQALVYSGVEVPEGRKVLHAVCDNPICCNPAHLKVGTQADNIRDMDEKGRRDGWRLRGAGGRFVRREPLERV